MIILFLSIGTQKNHLDEMILLHTQTDIFDVPVIDMR